MGYAHGKPSIQKPCEICGTIFCAQIPAIEKGWARFCSHKCHLIFVQINDTAEIKFKKSVNIPDDPSACWIWAGPIATKTGYGILKIKENGKFVQRRAHRISWQIYNGAIPAGMEVCHRCDVKFLPGSIEYRKCVNPSHLFLGTSRENMEDKVAKNRQARGNRQGSVKLKAENIPVIRKLLEEGITHKDIARQFNVSRSRIHFIKVKKDWAWVP